MSIYSPVPTTGTYTLITPQGQEISIPGTYGRAIEALANDGGFDAPTYQSIPQQRLREQESDPCGGCLLCGNARAYGVFCDACFARYSEDHEFAAMWFGDAVWAISVAEWEKMQAAGGSPEEIEDAWMETVGVIAAHLVEVTA